MGTVKASMKNKGTNETTESAEKYSVSSKRVAPSPSPFPLTGERNGMRGENVGVVMNFNVVRLKEGIKGLII